MSFLQNIFSFFKPHGKTVHPELMKAEGWTEMEVREFIKNLKQVIAWTRKLSSGFDFENGFHGKVFRQTNPLINNVALYSIDGDYATWNLDDYNPKVYHQLLELAIEARDKEYDLDLSEIDNLGKIISFETCITTHDGAPIVESQCFVDESDVPPIDTWFYLKKNYDHGGRLCDHALFCWIPKEFEELMQGAISVEIFDSYRWFHLNDQGMHKRIKNVS